MQRTLVTMIHSHIWQDDSEGDFPNTVANDDMKGCINEKHLLQLLQVPMVPSLLQVVLQQHLLLLSVMWANSCTKA